MKYALLIYDLPDTYERLPDDERDAVSGEYFAIGEHPNVVGGEQLEGIETATTVRVKDARRSPLRTVRRYKGDPRRLLLVEADDIDATLALAARIPAARLDRSVEVRPIVEQPS